jgi:23S rRNA (cytosine1962-C5)-methyltransferase
MAKLKIKLNRNLRRAIMQGHPWVYREAIDRPSEKLAQAKAQLCQVLDNKGELAWAIYDPHSALALRILSAEPQPPSSAVFSKRFARAMALRKSVRNEGSTTAYRLFNGEGDLLPGLVCDIYGSIAVIQFDGQGPSEFWDRTMISQWLLENTPCKTVLEKIRRSSGEPDNHVDPKARVTFVAGAPWTNEVIIRENDVTFKVNLEKGQKTGFFLDQRDNRNYLRQGSQGRSLLNLFSYSGGFSVNAGLGGATRVVSLDISKGALDLATENWMLNDLAPNLHSTLCLDVFDYLKTEKELWDHIVVDPPSMSHAENQKALAKTKYIELFAAAAKRVSKQGELSLSSCSSHIQFDDFFEVIGEALSLARRKGQIQRVSGQGPDHPFPHVCPELRYLKYVHLALD